MVTTLWLLALMVTVLPLVTGAPCDQAVSLKDKACNRLVCVAWLLLTPALVRQANKTNLR